jgi:hypothetical protein
MYMTELERLQQILAEIANLPPPSPTNMPTGPEQLANGYKVGWINGWVAYRQAIKRIVYPQGGG